MKALALVEMPCIRIEYLEISYALSTADLVVDLAVEYKMVPAGRTGRLEPTRLNWPFTTTARPCKYGPGTNNLGIIRMLGSNRRCQISEPQAIISNMDYRRLRFTASGTLEYMSQEKPSPNIAASHSAVNGAGRWLPTRRARRTVGA